MEFEGYFFFHSLSGREPRTLYEPQSDSTLPSCWFNGVLFEAGSHVLQAGLESAPFYDAAKLLMPLPLPPKCRDYKQAPPHPASQLLPLND